MASAETIAKALGGRKAGNGWTARCPAHDDREPSLSIRDGQPRVDAAGKPIFDQPIEFRDRSTANRFKEMVIALVRAADPIFPDGGES